jgi:hypothetical protein
MSTLVIVGSGGEEQRRQAAEARERRRRRLAAEEAQEAQEAAAGDDDAVERLRRFRLGLGGAPNPDGVDEGGEPTAGVPTRITERLLEQIGEPGMSCPVCRHTFRFGESVVVQRGQQESFVLRHHGGVLVCDRSASQEPTAELDSAIAFHAALDAAFPPEKDLRVVRLEPGHPLLALFHDRGEDQETVSRRYKCWVCGDTLRTGEAVVHCPCGQPEPCMSAIHRDPAQGLTCFDEWQRTPGRKSCLTFLVERKEQD